MARTPTVSDEEIYDAAYKVMGRRGADAFTISDVATETGLSRAAIILRFKSTHALKVSLLSRLVDKFTQQLESLPKTPSGNNLLEVAAFIGEYINGREGLSSFFSNQAENMKDTELAELERRRGTALFTTISRVMPETAIDHPSAIAAFTAHLTGNIISWIGSDEADPRRYLLMRTKQWLRLCGISFEDPAPCETISTPPTADTLLK